MKAVKAHLKHMVPRLLKDIETEAKALNRHTDCMICTAVLEAVVSLRGAARRVTQQLRGGMGYMSYNAFFYPNYLKVGASGNGYDMGLKIYRIEQRRALIGLQVNRSRYVVVAYNDKFS